MGMLRILAIGAHPDDLEILCGGTLARFAQLGYTVFMAHMMNGDKGHVSMDPAELARVRRQEAEAAASIIGAQSIGLGYPDGTLFSDLAARERVIDLIRQVRADVVLTHAPQDYMSDHTTTSEIVRDGSFYVTAPLFRTQHPAIAEAPPLYFMDTLAGVRFTPSEYVDISTTFDRKCEMLRCHRSQLQWLQENAGADILEQVRITGQFRGLQCGAEYAEAFARYEAWGRQPPARVLP